MVFCVLFTAGTVSELPKTTRSTLLKNVHFSVIPKIGHLGRTRTPMIKGTTLRAVSSLHSSHFCFP